MTERYSRCTNEACRRKWHHASIAYIAAPKHVIRKDLLDVPAPTPILQSVGPLVWLCPTCQSDMVPEAGTFEDLFQVQDAAA